MPADHMQAELSLSQVILPTSSSFDVKALSHTPDPRAAVGHLSKELSNKMMPGVGLYLPKSLHRSEVHAMRQALGETKMPTQAYRNIGRLSQDTNGSISKSSVDQDSFSAELAPNELEFTTIAFEYADFVVASPKRSSEAETFANLLRHIRQDLMEASRLYLSPTATSFLDAWPDKKTWIDAILAEIRTALNEVGTHIHLSRSDRDHDEASRLRRKFEYVLSHQKRLLPKQEPLVAAHQKLLGAISVMQTVEQCVGLGGPVRDPIFEVPVRPWLRYESEIVRGPYSRRASSKNLSSLSTAHSESRSTIASK